MTKDEMIKGLRYKAENIKAHMEPEFFAEVADYLESQKWILVKDQYPEVYEDVLVRDSDGYVTCARIYPWDVGIVFYETYSGECIEDVVEWRKIPE